MAATILHLSDGAWSAIAAWVALLLLSAAALVAFFQLRDARQLRREQAQPYVSVYMEPTEADFNAVNLIVKNFGATAAREIEIAIEPPIKSSINAEVDNVLVPSLIRTLVPGQQWSTFWDTTFHRKDTGLPAHHIATVRFEDSGGRQLGPYTFDLDWDSILGRGYLVTHGMHDLAKAFMEVRDLMKGWRTPGAEGLRVLAYDGDKYDEERREYYARRQAEQQRRQARQRPGDDAA